MYIDEKAHGRYIRELGGSWIYEHFVGKDGVSQKVQRVNGGILKDIEHARAVDYRGRRVHIAVAVLDNGECFMGKATCSHKDIYRRRHGYRQAVGRALKRAVRFERERTITLLDFVVDKDLAGRELFEACRNHMFKDRK